MMKYLSIILMTAFSLIIIGCTVQPNEWKGTIKAIPPISIDDKKINNNDVIWLDKSNKWFYRGGNKIVSSYETWDFDPQALVLRLQAPLQLNMYMGKPHSLFIKVFQLSEVRVFNDIAKTPAGIKELLTEDEVDASILSSETITISPNSTETLVLDRFKETRFVAIVAGYYQIDGKNNVRIFNIPSVANRLDELNHTLSDINPFAATADPEAGRIKAWIDLGVTGISRMQMIAE